MMKQDFETAELRRVIEEGLGFGLASLFRMPVCNQALNFKAVRASDGLPFLVKLVPVMRNPKKYLRRFENLARNLAALDGSKAERLLFSEAVLDFRDYRVRFLSWCEGECVPPDRLTDEQFALLVSDYLDFSEVLQRATDVLPRRNGIACRREALHGLRGFFSSRLVHLIEAEVPENAVNHDPARLKVIHGDFHQGNFRFRGGRLSGVFDLEELRYGYPSEDIVRYFVCVEEHLRWYEWRRTRRLLLRFEKAVGAFQYPAEEWGVAINMLFLQKVVKRVRRHGGVCSTLNLIWRFGFYRKMREIAGRGAWVR